MPTQVTINGKTYTEYSVTELEAMKLEREEKEQLRTGKFTARTSIFSQTQTTNPSGMKHRKGI